jgi:hypothetical protein
MPEKSWQGLASYLLGELGISQRLKVAHGSRWFKTIGTKYIVI